jgi:hypothetical protein
LITIVFSQPDVVGNFEEKNRVITVSRKRKIFFYSTFAKLLIHTQ